MTAAPRLTPGACASASCQQYAPARPGRNPSRKDRPPAVLLVAPIDGVCIRGDAMTENTYYFEMYERLQPRTEWRGGIEPEDTLPQTLNEAARLASGHAGVEITPADFLQAASRGQIALRAIVHRHAKVQASDGGVFCNAGTENENIVPAGSIPTLPLTACEHLAATGRAKWRTFDGRKEIDGEWMRYTKGRLLESEPDFVTTPEDCRVIGRDVHALADAYLAAALEDAKRKQQEQAAPVQQPALAPAAPAERILKRKVLIAQLKHEWETIDSDLREASRNGLTEQASAGNGCWYVDRARAWAETRGKLKLTAKMSPLPARWPPSMNNLPSKTHKIKG